MSDTQVSRLLGIFSPVAMTRTIVSSIWNTMDNMLQRLLGIPGRICYFCFGCVRLVMNPLTSMLEYKRESRPATSQVPDLPTLLTGVPDPTCEQVSNAVRCIHNSAINIIVNQISQKNKLQEYRNELQRWREENEKEIVDLYNLDERDKITMKTLAISVKKLKALKAKKNKFAKLNNEKMLKVANKSNLSTEDLKIIKESNKNLNEIDFEMNKNKKECLDMVKTSERLSQLFTKVLLHNEFFYDCTLEPEVPLNNIMNKLRAITYKSQLENDAFKSSLVVTNEKLDKILTATERISTALDDFREELPDIPSMKNELAALRSQLEQEQLVLRNVKGERDIMRVKLDVLEDLIEDQEDFLNSRENQDIEGAVVQ
ncbi:putative leucine-rich repeat-containing protein DDB_G0290503 isoform X2 [Parasteatoda tepidariorum]|uniref:putative leucine-rich repeat-containing protein DDB_G0290503 isoform X2 n=1 Tax=Parasteatoda tepidariorum TaxID=114398 RepID=UPI00077FAF52|nr:uncharacterized protein LOC107441828 isoform X2 [Parasteatoda tepidariorum]